VRRDLNQDLFREVNERIAELAATLDAHEGPPSFFCECRRLGCREMLEIPLRLYAIVRDDDDLYVVLPGHENRDQEQTVSDQGAFLIVRTLRSNLSATASAALQQPG
jgi:hypothetical protein